MDFQLKNELYDQLVKSNEDIQDVKDYSVSLWDFGGQDEFIATHQLFIHEESLALLVMDMSIGLHDVLPDSTEAKSRLRIPQTPAGFLHFWLDTIHKKATDKNLKPNIAVVLTHRDLIPDEEAGEYMTSWSPFMESHTPVTSQKKTFTLLTIRMRKEKTSGNLEENYLGS